MSFEIKPFPLTRQVVIDSGRQGIRRHTITALIEVDVTDARRILRVHKEKTGEAISFTAFILSCLGATIDQNRYFHARRDLLGRLVLFDEVDCATLMEVDLQGQKFPLAHVIHSINRRSVSSIHDEIRSIQADPNRSPSFQYNNRLMAAFLLLPAFVRDLFYGLLGRMPRAFKSRAGTVQVSAVGMFGTGGGFGMSPAPIYTTGLLLGGIAEKPGVVKGQIVIREYLDLTIFLDHDIIDGAPAVRFIDRLKTRIETAYGLEDFQAAEEPIEMYEI